MSDITGPFGGEAGEVVAPGFRLLPPSEEWGETKWTLTGVLPGGMSPRRDISHYDLEDRLVACGLLTRAQCDSESGQFFAYPSDRAHGLRVGAWLKERLERDVTASLLE